MKIAATLLLSLTSLQPVNDIEKGAPQAPADRAIRCGLGKSFHAGRRAELMRRAEKGVMVFRGLPVPRQNREFRQDKTFWYLTGINSRDAALVLDASSGREILLLPERKRVAGTEVWDGEIWDTEDEWVTELTGFEEIRSNRELQDVLRELTEEEKTVWISKHPSIELQGSYDTASKFNNAQRRDPFDGRTTREDAFEAKLEDMLDGVEIKDCRFDLIEMRLHKTPEEMEAMRAASRIGALAMVDAMRSTQPGVGEWELDALIAWSQIRHGATGPAYDAIVGSGPNALVLHYLASDRVLRPAEMLLIDFAPEASHYVSDITRSWPTDGKFTPRMAELYDAVLEAQKAGIAVCKPGITMRQVSKACDAKLRELGFGKLTVHGACHFIGMEVHDPDSSQANEPLGPGACFTIEPGLYERETNIGIRIEDVVAITEDGCEILSSMVPKEREELEGLIGKGGILQKVAETEGQ